MRKKPSRILLIDNDEGVLTALVTRLEHLGYTCITADSGARGIAAFREQKIDLVITDLNMPMGNGLELAKSIRRTSMVPILVVTGFHDEFKRRLLHVPNVAVVRKPFETEHLMELVELSLAMAAPAFSDALSVDSA